MPEQPTLFRPPSKEFRPQESTKSSKTSRILFVFFVFFCVSCLQPLRQLLVIRGVTRPALRGRIPTIVLDLRIDAAIDQELHRLVVPVPDEFVQNAGRLMRTPGRIDVRAVLKQEVGHLEVVVDDGPGERHVEHPLLTQ